MVISSRAARLIAAALISEAPGAAAVGSACAVSRPGTTVPVCDLIMAHAGEARSRAW